MMHNFTFKPGTQNQIVNLFIPDVTLAADVAVSPTASFMGSAMIGVLFTDISKTSFIREGDTADTLIAEVAGVVGAYTSGGFILIDDTNMPGWYQFGIPNACLANGAAFVDIGMAMAVDHGADIQIHIDLIRALATG